MADKASFTPEEWKQLLESPMLASIAVTARRAHGLPGTLQKRLRRRRHALSREQDRCRREQAAVRAVVTGFGSSEGHRAARDGLQARLTGEQSPSEAPDEATQALAPGRSASGRPGAERSQRLRGLAADHGRAGVAGAAQAGGRLVFSSVPVSDAEKRRLPRIFERLEPEGLSSPALSQHQPLGPDQKARSGPARTESRRKQSKYREVEVIFARLDGSSRSSRPRSTC